MLDTILGVTISLETGGSIQHVPKRQSLCRLTVNLLEMPLPEKKKKKEKMRYLFVLIGTEDSKGKSSCNE